MNACLFPLCAAHGLTITTVEGVGNPKTGLHEVQVREDTNLSTVESRKFEVLRTRGFISKYRKFDA